jgi:hypothetical protein
MVHQGRDITQGADTVELAFRPTRADILRGIQVRDRIRRLAPASAAWRSPGAARTRDGRPSLSSVP